MYWYTNCMERNTIIIIILFKFNLRLIINIISINSRCAKKYIFWTKINSRDLDKWFEWIRASKLLLSLIPLVSYLFVEVSYLWYTSYGPVIILMLDMEKILVSKSIQNGYRNVSNRWFAEFREKDEIH